MIQRRIVSLIFLFLSVIVVYGERVITLEEVRLLAIDNNRELQISSQQFLAAQSFRKASYTRFLPSFDFTSQYIRMNQPFNLLSKNLFLPIVPFSAINPETGNLIPVELLLSDPPALVVGPDGYPVKDSDGNFVFRQYAYIPKSEAEIGGKNNIFMNFSLMQPIFTGGKIKAQYRAAQHIEQMAYHGQKLSQAEVLIEVESLFWQLITVQEKVELATQYKNMLQSLTYDIEGYIEEGIVNRNDLLRAKVALNESELEYMKAENGIVKLSMALCRLTGLPLTQRLVAKAEQQDSTMELTLEELWHQGLEQRHEISMVKEQTGLAASIKDLVGAARYPDLALGASYFAVNPNPYNGMEKEFGHDWFIGATLTLPVFHWGERRQLHKAAVFGENAQQLRLEDTFDLIKMDITRSFLDMEEAKKNVEIKKKSLEQASDNLYIAQDNFREGALTTTDLLEAKAFWHQAQTDLIESKNEFRTRYAELTKAIGN